MTPIKGAQQLETHQTQEVERKRKLPSFIPDTDGVILDTLGNNILRGTASHMHESTRQFNREEERTRVNLAPDIHVTDFKTPVSKKRNPKKIEISEQLKSEDDIWIRKTSDVLNVHIGVKPGFVESIDTKKVKTVRVPKHPYWPEITKPTSPNTSKLISISRLPGQSDKVIVDLVEPFTSRKDSETNSTIIQIEKHTDTVAEVLGTHTDNKPITISTQGFDLAILRRKDPKSIAGTVIDLESKGKYIVLRSRYDFDLLIKIPDEIKDFDPVDRTNMVKIREVTKFLAKSLKNQIQE